jgi:hypothetical protein
VKEMSRCFDDARDDPAVGVIILTGLPSLSFPALCNFVPSRNFPIQYTHPGKLGFAETGGATGHETMDA